MPKYSDVRFSAFVYTDMFMTRVMWQSRTQEFITLLYEFTHLNFGLFTCKHKIKFDRGFILFTYFKYVLWFELVGFKALSHNKGQIASKTNKGANCTKNKTLFTYTDQLTNMQRSRHCLPDIQEAQSFIELQYFTFKTGKHTQSSSIPNS